MSAPVRSTAEYLVDLIENLPASRGVRFTAELWDKAEVSPPHGSVGTPELRRRAPEGAESQLSADDWWIDYTISLYFDFNNWQESQQAMVDAVCAFISAIDADPSLGGNVLDAAVAQAVPFYARLAANAARPLVGYEITVATLTLVVPTTP